MPCGSNSVCMDTEGSFNCTCNEGYELTENCTDIDECAGANSSSLCNEFAVCMNTDGGYTCVCQSGYITNGTEGFCIDVDECENPSDNECDERAMCVNTEGSYDCLCSPGYQVYGFSCNCTDGDTRLLYANGGNSTIITAQNAQSLIESCVVTVDSSLAIVNISCRSPHDEDNVVEGRVEVCKRNSFHTVCDDGWGMPEATVVCSQLNSATDGVQPVVRSSFLYGEGSGVILLSELMCSGSEHNLLECPLVSQNRSCDHTEDAGVRCGGCEDNSTRIVIGDGTEDINTILNVENYLIDGNLATGRIEICTEGVWSPVCQDSWTEADGSVACYQMGFSRYGALVGNQRFVTAANSLFQLNLNCDGTEDHLGDCGPVLPLNVSLRSGCMDVRRSAYIVCQDRSIQDGNCSDGEVRLQSGALNLVREGRVEVCVNHVWGTVCEKQFSEDDSQVVCAQMDFERRGSMVLEDRQRFMELDEALPIFLSTLDCNNLDRFIINCPRTDLLGLTDCIHSQDVFIRCEAVCEAEPDTSSFGTYQWPVISAERNLSIACQYGSALSSAGLAEVQRYCDPRGRWLDADFSECASFSDSTLRNISMLTLANISAITEQLFTAIAQATDSEQSLSNIANISETFRIVNANCTANTQCSLGSDEVQSLTNAIDSLQNWTTNIRQMESAEIAINMEGIVADYIQELSLPSDQALANVTRTFTSVDGEITYSGLKKHTDELQEKGVMYSVSLASGNAVKIQDYDNRSFNASDIEDVAILIPPDAFMNQTNTDTSIVFSTFQRSILYPLGNGTLGPQFQVDSTVVSATVVGSENISADITIVLRLITDNSQVPMCVFWDGNAAGGRGNWSDTGCRSISRHNNVVVCRCTHLSSFGVLVNTNPIQCDSLSVPNPSVTECIPQKPRVNITTENGIQDGNVQASVVIGRSYEVACNSTGEYRGRVTWLRMGEMVTEVPEVPFQRDTNISAFSRLLEETSGQLYAYRVSPTSVILGTRHAMEFGAAIGIGTVANGHYLCLAQNRNESASVSLSVTVEEPMYEKTSYIRFSSRSFAVLQSELRLSSANLVEGVLGTEIFKTFRASGVEHLTVSCNEEAMRPDDIMNRWSRVACSLEFNMDNLLIPGESITANLISANLVENNSLARVIQSSNGFCNYEEFESPDNRGEYKWPESMVGNRTNLPCVYGNQDESAQEDGMATRICMGNLMWGMYDGSTCATLDTKLLRDLSSRPVTAAEADNVIMEVANVVNNLNENDEQTEANAELIASVFNQFDELIETGNFSVTPTIAENSLSVVDDISSWPAESLEQQASGIVQSFETIVNNLALNEDGFTLNEEQISVTSDEPDLEMVVNPGDLLPVEPAEFSKANNLTGSGEEDIVSNITIVDSRIEISPNAFPVDSSYVLGRYADASLFPALIPEGTNQSDFDVVADTEVIGFSIPQQENVSNITVKYTVQSLMGRMGIDVYSPVCVSWVFDFLIDGNTTRGNWSDRGCKLMNFDEETKTYTCECNHLTNFAVLVNTNAPPVSPAEQIALQTLTIVGAVLSIAGLTLTIFTMIYFKKLRVRDASKFHVQLCIAMLCMLIVFVVGIDRTENTVVCTAISALIQYFTLAAAFWMGGEAVLMFKKLIIVFGRVTKSFLVIISLICWGVPLIFPAAGLATLATGENYLITLPSADSSGGYCFISDNRVRYGVFAAPLFAIIVFNLIVFVLVARVLVKHSKRNIGRAKGEKNKRKVTMGTLKTLVSIVSVMLMFGLSWLFGAFSVSQAAVAFRWLFIIFNTTQGFWLFVFFCVIGADAREEWKKLLSCYRYKGKEKGATPSGTGTKPKSYGTKETPLSSRRIASYTIRRSVGLLEKGESMDFDSSVAPIEMSEVKTIKTDFHSISEEDTSLIIPNDLPGLNQPKSPDSQLPPQILFRLKRSHYDVMAEPSECTSSISPDFSNEDMEITDEYDSSKESEASSTVEFTEL